MIHGIARARRATIASLGILISACSGATEADRYTPAFIHIAERMLNSDFHAWLVTGFRALIVAALAAVLAPEAAAQRPEGLNVQVGLGTFLSRDRGWNYAESIEVFAAVSKRAGGVDVLAGASFFKTFATFSYPDIVPRPPRAITDGLAARFHVRIPSATRSSVGAIAGTEIVRNLTSGEPRSTTAAGAAGLGLNLGRAEIGVRYVGFARRLGSSRGMMPLSLGWRF